jgi:hypothetical protein
MNNQQRTKAKNNAILITIIGFLIIVIAGIIPFIDKSNIDKDNIVKVNMIANSLATILGSIGGVLIGTGITALVNLDPLEEIISSLRDDENTRISSKNTKEIASKFDHLSKLKRVYRYFETVNENDEKEWRMKDLKFYISSDSKRIRSNITYHFSSGDFVYELQAAFIGKHLLLISEEVQGRDETIVEIYPNFRIGQGNIFPGISIRYPWKSNTLMYTYSMLSEEILINQDSWKEKSSGYWILVDSQKQTQLQDIWKEKSKTFKFFV